MQVKYTSDDVVVEINGMKCVGFADYNDHEKQILVDEGFQRMARKIAVLEQQRAELLEVLQKADIKILGMYEAIAPGSGLNFYKSDPDYNEIQNAIQKAEQ